MLHVAAREMDTLIQKHFSSPALEKGLPAEAWLSLEA